MPIVEYRSPMPASQQELFAYHERPGALERLTPPWVDVRILKRIGGLADGVVVLSMPGRADPPRGGSPATTTTTRRASSATGRRKGRSPGSSTRTLPAGRGHGRRRAGRRGTRRAC